MFGCDVRHHFPCQKLLRSPHQLFMTSQPPPPKTGLPQNPEILSSSGFRIPVFFRETPKLGFNCCTSGYLGQQKLRKEANFCFENMPFQFTVDQENILSRSRSNFGDVKTVTALVDKTASINHSQAFDSSVLSERKQKSNNQTKPNSTNKARRTL